MDNLRTFTFYNLYGHGLPMACTPVFGSINQRQGLPTGGRDPYGQGGSSSPFKRTHSENG